MASTYGQSMAAHLDSNDTEVPIPTQEAISTIKFAPSGNQVYAQFGFALMAVAFWDGNIVIYQAQPAPQGD